MRVKTQATMYLVFCVACILTLPRLIPKPEEQSAVRLLEVENYLRYSSLFFLIWTAFFTTLYLLSFMSLNFSNYPKPSFFLPFFSKKYPKGRAILSGNVKIDRRETPFCKVIIFSDIENQIGYFYTNGRGRFKIKIRPGKYILQAEGFGFEGKATHPIIVKPGDITETELDCFSKEDIVINPKSYHNLIAEKYALLVPAIVAPILGWFLNEYYFATISLVVITTGLCLFIVFAVGKSQKLIIRNRKGTRLRNREIEITDSTGKKKYKAETDFFGNIIALFSPGIYKISAKGCLPRNLRIKNKSIANANLKLG